MEDDEEYKKRKSSVCVCVLSCGSETKDKKKKKKKRKKASTVDNGVPVCDTLAWSSGSQREMKGKDALAAQRASLERTKRIEEEEERKRKLEDPWAPHS